MSSAHVAYGQYGKNRLTEALPGIIDWSLLLGITTLSIFAPLAAIGFILLFDLYWLFKVIYFVIHLIAAYRQYRRALAVDWRASLSSFPVGNWPWQMIFLPTYKDEYAIVRSALDSLLKSDYPSNRILVVLGGEGRDAAHFAEISAAVRRDFEGRFGFLRFTLHPADLPGEIPGKGSNLRHMAVVTREYLATTTYEQENIILSACDIDTVFHRHYFSALAHAWLTISDRHRTAYQPVTTFSNNLWSASAPVRVAAFGTTFWLFSELIRPERLWTFSSHSMSWKMLGEVGDWEPGVVSEDSRIFMQAFLHYDGNYRVTPIFLPLAMDTVVGATWRESVLALYRQQRRWAWGVEHIPYMLAEFPKHPQIPFRKKFTYLFNHFEGTISWACVPFLIFIAGFLPFFFVKGESNSLFVNSPYVLEWLMRGSMIGLFVTSILSFAFIPPRPAQLPKTAWFGMFWQWLLFPVSIILFGAIPALDAHTRLLFGKYLGFNVTIKSANSRTL